jgi:signal transduction histidine kinase
LPAVLFDLCLQSRFRALVRSGYALSVTATIPHIYEVFRADADYHRWALTTITIGFGLLTAIAAVLVYREKHERAATSRLVGTMSLFLLAMSFVHLGSGHAEQIWSQELAFHHLAIPLALLVLLQDYRFVLLDAFVRFLTNVFLAAIFVSAGILAWRGGWLPRGGTPFELALLLAAACLTLVLFAVVRGVVQGLLTRTVFRHPNERALLRELRTPAGDEAEYIQSASTALGRFWQAAVSIAAEAPASKGAEAAVSVRAGDGTVKYIVLGRRAGGRRYLSEDLQALHRAGAVIAEQIEERRESELRRLVAQAELRALQSQIHPHFLFNALNTLYGIIPKEARGARDTVLNLADIFRYFLETKKTLVPLEEELRIVKAYLEIERLRLGDKLAVEMKIDSEAAPVPIPILSVQPLVENAVKHGIAPLSAGGMVSIEIRVDHGSLTVSVRDTGRGFSQQPRAGVGLENVQRRLALCFGDDAKLSVESGSSGSEVSLHIPAPAIQFAGTVK